MDPILNKDLVKELGLESLPEEKQLEILEKIGSIIFQSVLLRVLDLLDDDQKDELEKLFKEKADDPNAVLKFMEDNVPDIDGIVKEEVTKFKTETLDIITKIN